MKLKRRFFNRLAAGLLWGLLALSLAACGNTALAAPLNDGKLTFCHATGEANTPYEALTVNFNELSAHATHAGDLIPAGAEGCPKAVVTGYNLGKINLCHATGSAANPYTEITVNFNGLQGHAKHPGDLIPRPPTGCPTVIPTPAMTATVTPAATFAAEQTGTLTLCHATGRAKNPYVLLTISLNGLNGHDKHPGDLIPAPAEGCPK